MSVWQTLGIDPTDDLIVIKKAYAARLKRTRPDDDAVAYQALRDAYEFAQQHARGARQRGAPEPAPPTPPDGTPPVQEVELESEVEVEAQPVQTASMAYVHPRDLAQQTRHYLQQAGGDALVAGWPTLERELDNLPLWQRREASNWFAQLVIDTEDMPAPFVQALARYFDWGTDFRTEQALGTARAVALQERLRLLSSGFHADEAFKQRYHEVALFAQLAQQVARWKLYLFATLAPSRLGRLWNELAPKHRYALGLPPALHSLADHAIEMAAWLRTGAVLLLAASLVQLSGYADAPWLSRVLSVVLIGGGGITLLHFAHGACLNAKAALHALLQQRRQRKGGAARSDSVPVWALLGLVLFAAVLSGLAESGTARAFAGGSGGLAFGCMALLLLITAVFTPALPRTAATPALPVILLLCVCIGVRLPLFDALPWTGACAGVAWFTANCIAHARYETRIEARWQALRQAALKARSGTHKSGWRSHVASALWLLRCTAGWPYVLMQFAAAQSPRFLIAVATIAVIALPPGMRAWQMPFSAAVVGVFVLLSGLFYKNALKAIVPGQQAAWRGWVGIAVLALWLAWIGLYFGAGAWIDARLGWQPTPKNADAWTRQFGLALGIPLLLMLWGASLFKLERRPAAGQGSRRQP